MNFKEFTTKHGITCRAFTTNAMPSKTDIDEGNPDHWLLVLRCDGKAIPIYYSTGTGLRKYRNGEYKPEPPTVADAIGSLTFDCLCARMDIHEFCDEFGYNIDSIKTRTMYENIVKEAEKVKFLLGDLFDEFMELEED